MTLDPDKVFREEALRRYAEDRQSAEPLRDVSAAHLWLLWFCAGLLLCGLCIAGWAVAAQLGGLGAG